MPGRGWMGGWLVVRWRLGVVVDAVAVAVVVMYW